MLTYITFSSAERLNSMLPVSRWLQEKLRPQKNFKVRKSIDADRLIDNVWLTIKPGRAVGDVSGVKIPAVR